MDPEQAVMGIYNKFIKAFNWTLRDLDETNFETLIDYIFYKDPNVRIINGKEYKRAQGAPKWL
jgi:hypothetical protein